MSGTKPENATTRVSTLERAVLAVALVLTVLLLLAAAPHERQKPEPQECNCQPPIASHLTSVPAHR